MNEWDAYTLEAEYLEEIGGSQEEINGVNTKATTYYKNALRIWDTGKLPPVNPENPGYSFPIQNNYSMAKLFINQDKYGFHHPPGEAEFYPAWQP